MKTRVYASAASLALLLAGCGGGGELDLGDLGSGGPSYVNWTNSANGTVVLDSDNEEFYVDVDTRQVVDRSEVQLRNLIVTRSAEVIDNGTLIGTVSLVTSSSGRPIAMFHCMDGSLMDLTLSVSGWTHSCRPGGPRPGSGDSSGGSGSNSGSGGNSGSSNSGSSNSGSSNSGSSNSGSSNSDSSNSGSGNSGSGNSGTGSNTSSGPPSSRGFITWNGSTNGDVVLDANNEHFKFYADTLCIYSVNRGEEYGNFCLSGRNSAVIVFGGEQYTVSAIRATDGTCIAGVLNSSGFVADFHTGSDRMEYVSNSTVRPSSC